MAAALSFGSAVLGQLENAAQVAQLGQNMIYQQEQIWWARRSYLLDSQSVRLDTLDHAKEEIKSHYDTYVGRIDTLLLVLALIFPFALNVIQFSDPFIPGIEEEDCPGGCIESHHTWLVTVWACLIGIVLILPFWGILMLIRCKLKLDRWLELALAGLHRERRGVVRVSKPSPGWILHSAQDEHARADSDKETEQIVYHLVNMVLEFQQYMNTMWKEELGPLVQAATVLLWLSASSALLLTSLSVWVFLVNKGGAHTVGSFYFAVILTLGCVAPLLYMARQSFREEVQVPDKMAGIGLDHHDQAPAPHIESSDDDGERRWGWNWEHWQPPSPMRAHTQGLWATVVQIRQSAFGLCARRQRHVVFGEGADLLGPRAPRREPAQPLLRPREH